MRAVRKGEWALDPSVFGFAPLCSIKILAGWIGVTPEAVLARFKKGQFPAKALLRLGGRSLAVDLQTLMVALRAKNAVPLTLAEKPKLPPEDASDHVSDDHPIDQR
jgi:hypothetical protein